MEKIPSAHRLGPPARSEWQALPVCPFLYRLDRSYAANRGLIRQPLELWGHLCRCLGRCPPTSVGATECADSACCPGSPQFIAAAHWHARWGCLLRCL